MGGLKGSQAHQNASASKRGSGRTSILMPWRETTVRFTVALLALTWPPAPGSAQSLNNAVRAQLAVSGAPAAECNVLLAGDPASVLTGELFNICTRGVPAAGGGSTSSGGGGAATPSTLPGVIEERLERASKPNTAASEDKSTRGAQTSVEWKNGIGAFGSVEYENVDRDVTNFEDGYDSDLVRVIAGGDYRFSEQVVAGIAFDGYGHHGSYNAGGHFEDYSLGVLAFGSIAPVENVSVEVNAGYARGLYDRTRTASFTQLDSVGAVDFTTSGRTRSDYEANGFHAAALASYDFQIDNVTISPQAGAEFRQLQFPSYNERGNTGLELAFRSDEQTWVQSRVGAVVSAAISTAIGVVVPQASFDWKHEFANNQRNMTVSFVGDTRRARFRYETQDPDRDFFLVGGGASIVLGHGIQAFVAYRALVGHSFFESHAASAGVRKAF